MNSYSILSQGGVHTPKHVKANHSNRRQTMINTYYEYMTQNTSTGGVAPLRHDLAREVYIQKRKAERELDYNTVKLSRVLAPVSKLVVRIAQRVTDNSVGQHPHANPEAA